MPENFYQLLWIFLIYAFAGWSMEVSYAALEKGKFVNRGFLNGPVCPIYGFGMLLILSCLWQFRNNIILLFLGSVLLTTALEFVTGYILEKFFHDKWWDYSDFPFNIKGYVCLKFSILWGLAATGVVGIVHRFIYMLVDKVPFKIGVIFLIVFSCAFLADFIITLIELLKIPKKLKALLELERLLDGLSDNIGEGISDKTLALKEKSEDFREDLGEKKAELEKKKDEYIKLLSDKNQIQERIFKAFPNLKNGKYKTAFERFGNAIQEKLHEGKE